MTLQIFCALLMAISLPLVAHAAPMIAAADKLPNATVSLDNAWQLLANGISNQTPPFRSFRISEPESPLYGLELCTYEVKNGFETLHLKDVRKHGAIASIYTKNIPKSASVAFTGGFFGYAENGSFAPLGLAISERKKINKKHSWISGGIVQVRDNLVEIVPIHRFSEKSDILTAIQSKPLLVEAGQNGIRSSNSAHFDRVAIATTSDGQVMVIMVSTPTGKGATLAEFASLLLRIRTKSGGSVSWALALDGGPGAHLMFGRTHCGRGEPNYVPNLLYLQP